MPVLSVCPCKETKSQQLTDWHPTSATQYSSMCLFGHFLTGGRFSKRSKSNTICRKWETELRERENIFVLTDSLFSWHQSGIWLFWQALHVIYGAAAYTTVVVGKGKSQGMNHCDLVCQSLSHCGPVLQKTHKFFWEISQVNIQTVIFVSCNSLGETALCHSLSERGMHCVLEHLSDILRSNGEWVRGQPPGQMRRSGGQ